MPRDSESGRSALLSCGLGLLACLLLALACGDPVANASRQDGDTGRRLDASDSAKSRDTDAGTAHSEPEIDGGASARARVHFSQTASNFWRMPWPSDLRREADGSFDWQAWPDVADAPWVQMWFDALTRRKDAWGVNSAIVVPVSGRVDATSLPVDGQASLNDDASVFLLDVDPASPERGQRLPVSVSYRAPAELYASEHLIVAVPHYGFVRRANTTYALVVTRDVLDSHGRSLVGSDEFARALAYPDADDEALAEHLEPLREALERFELEPADVVGAAVFTTSDPHDKLRRLATWAEALPLPKLGPWRFHSQTADYVAVEAEFDVPIIQRGEPPFREIGEGLIEWQGSAPHVLGSQPFRLVLNVPTAAANPERLPLVIYLHGSGGNAEQVLDRGPTDEIRDAPRPVPGTGPASWLAQAGLASVGFDFPLHGSRHDPPDPTGLMLYNLLGNIDATVDNFQVAATELWLLTRVLETLQLDSSEISELQQAVGDRTIAFDPDALSAIGQSMGSTIGIPWASLDPRLDAAVWSGAGGILAEIALSARQPLQLKPILAQLMNLEPAELTSDHPLLHALQTLWDQVDPVSVAAHVSRFPIEPNVGKHQLMLAGYEDGYFSPRAQGALALALGTPLVTAPVEETLPSWLWGARESAPVTANLHDQLTVGLSQWSAPNGFGHDVLFNQRQVQEQVLCFLAGVGERTAPSVVGAGMGCGE